MGAHILVNISFFSSSLFSFFLFCLLFSSSPVNGKRMRGGGGGSNWCQPERGQDEADGRGGKKRPPLLPAAFISASAAVEGEGG